MKKEGLEGCKERKYSGKELKIKQKIVSDRENSCGFDVNTLNELRLKDIICVAHHAFTCVMLLCGDELREEANKHEFMFIKLPSCHLIFYISP